MRKTFGIIAGAGLVAASVAACSSPEPSTPVETPKPRTVTVIPKTSEAPPVADEVTEYVPVPDPVEVPVPIDNPYPVDIPVPVPVPGDLVVVTETLPPPPPVIVSETVTETFTPPASEPPADDDTEPAEPEE